jgi:hypothetical protein
MSIKGGCITGLDWSKAIHIWTKNAIMPIPEDSESHSEESGFTDYSSNNDTSSQSQNTALDQPSELVGSGTCHLPEAGKPIVGACELSG